MSISTAEAFASNTNTRRLAQHTDPVKQSKALMQVVYKNSSLKIDEFNDAFGNSPSSSLVEGQNTWISIGEGALAGRAD